MAVRYPAAVGPYPCRGASRRRTPRGDRGLRSPKAGASPGRPPTRGSDSMIQRIDRLGVELPPPSDPDPDGAAAVQELMGGPFGEMSTFMNYTFQSSNFRGRQSARPFYDLIANIAAEEFGHIELVAAAINTMLTDPAQVDAQAPDATLAKYKGQGATHHFLAGGKGALAGNSTPRRSMRWIMETPLPRGWSPPRC